MKWQAVFLSVCSICQATTEFVDVSVLAWQAIVGGLEFTLQNGQLQAPDFSWEPAFKINVGMQFDDRCWETGGRWTYFHSKSSRTVEETDALLPIWILPTATGGRASLAEASYDLLFNGVDVEMVYHPYLLPHLSTRFVTGIKVLQIHQTFDVNYGLDNADIFQSTTGAGPRLGFQTEWQFGAGFSLLGSLITALPLWHYRVNRNDQDSLANTRFWIFRPIVESAFGFGWERSHFGLNATYEFQYYSEQNMMAMLVNPATLSQMFLPRGDLMLHGASITLHFGF